MVLFSLVLLQLSTPIMTTDTAMIAIHIRSPGRWTLRLVDRSRSHLISSIPLANRVVFSSSSQKSRSRADLCYDLFSDTKYSSRSWIQFIQLAMFHAIP